jgi:hypothetical protein
VNLIRIRIVSPVVLNPRKCRVFPSHYSLNRNPKPFLAEVCAVSSKHEIFCVYETQVNMFPTRDLELNTGFPGPNICSCFPININIIIIALHSKKYDRFLSEGLYIIIIVIIIIMHY